MYAFTARIRSSYEYILTPSRSNFLSAGPTYYTNYLFFASLFVGMLLCSFVGLLPQLCLPVSVALMGLGFSTASVGFTLWATDLELPEKSETMIERVQLAYAIGNLLGSPIPGWVADYTGSYAPAYRIYVGEIVLCLCLIQMQYRKRRGSIKI